MKLINLHRISYFMLKTARCQFSFMFKLPDAYLSLADVDWKRKGLITGFHMCWHQHFLGDALELCDIQVEPGKSVPSRFRVEQMGFKFRPVTHLIQHTESTPPSVLSFVSSAVSQIFRPCMDAHQTLSGSAPLLSFHDAWAQESISWL